MKFLKRILPVCLLVIADQAIKLSILKYMMDREFDLAGNILGFKPHLNDQYSWINSLADLGISLVVHILLVSGILLITLIIYDFIRTKYSMSTYVYGMFAVLFSGILCSLIDKAAWGGSLDYIWLKGFFIFDLKDVYITIFEGMLVLYIFLNKEFRDLKFKAVVKEFIRYCKTKYFQGRRKSV